MPGRRRSQSREWRIPVDVLTLLGRGQPQPLSPSARVAEAFVRVSPRLPHHCGILQGNVSDA